MDGETVREDQRLAGLQIRRDVFLISRGLFRIRQRNKNHVGAADSFAGADDFKSLFFGWLGMDLLPSYSPMMTFEAAVFDS